MKLNIKQIIIIVCIILILLTLKINIKDNTITIQFGLWQYIKDLLR